MFYFLRLFKIKYIIIWKNNISCLEIYIVLIYFEFNKLMEVVCDKMMLFLVVMVWNGVIGYLVGRGVCLCIFG